MPVVISLYLVLTALAFSNPVVADEERPLWQGHSGDVEVRWTSRDVYTKSGRGDFAPLFKGGFMAGVTAEPGCRIDGELKILSLVGNYLTYEKSFEKNCTGRVEPLRTVYRGVVRVGRTRHAAKLTDLYDEQLLSRTLMAHPIVRRSLEKTRELVVNRSLASLMRSLSHFVIVYDVDDYECRASLDQVLNGFAFERLSAEGVSIRLFLELDGSRSCQMNPLEVSVTLPLPEKLKRAITLAEARAEGFLVDQADGLTGRAVSKGRTETPCGNEPTDYCPLKNAPPAPEK